MSRRNRYTRVSAIFAMIGAAAVAAGFAIGMTGWPPARANATADIGQQAPLSVEETAGADTFAAETSTLTAEATQTADTAAFSGPAAVGAHGAKSKMLQAAPKHKKIVRHGAKKKRRTVRYVGGPWRSARVSWYGPGFYGNTMAGGGKLTRTSMVVAHRSLPFGTKIQFKYKGRTVVATVRDRGPYVAGRTFDLGPGVARKLRFSGVGTVRYRIVRRR